MDEVSLVLSCFVKVKGCFSSANYIHQHQLLLGLNGSVDLQQYPRAGEHSASQQEHKVVRPPHGVKQQVQVVQVVRVQEDAPAGGPHQAQLLRQHRLQVPGCNSSFVLVMGKESHQGLPLRVHRRQRGSHCRCRLALFHLLGHACLQLLRGNEGGGRRCCRRHRRRRGGRRCCLNNRHRHHRGQDRYHGGHWCCRRRRRRRRGRWGRLLGKGLLLLLPRSTVPPGTAHTPGRQDVGDLLVRW
mmetsp:Transcript_39868/g.68828  ORF Transcript_39868/g.68828 Transcript_39868/m.68828 type:complete len:242 (+) Transcript_39868:1136-1861(+)